MKTNRRTDDRWTLVRWATLLGLGVGVAWVAASFVFFSAPESTVVSIGRLAAAISCPPLMLTDIFVAPAANAALYGVVAFLWSLARENRRDNGARIGKA